SCSRSSPLSSVAQPRAAAGVQVPDGGGVAVAGGDQRALIRAGVRSRVVPQSLELALQDLGLLARPAVGVLVREQVALRGLAGAGQVATLEAPPSDRADEQAAQVELG